MTLSPESKQMVGTETRTGTSARVQSTHEANASTHGTQKPPITHWSLDVPELMGFHDCAAVYPVAMPLVRTGNRGEWLSKRNQSSRGQLTFEALCSDQVPWWS